MTFLWTMLVFLCWLDLLGQNLIGSTLTFALCFADHWRHKYKLHTRLDVLQARSFIIALTSTAQISKNQVGSLSNPRVEVVTGVCRVDWRLRQWDQARWFTYWSIFILYTINTFYFMCFICQSRGYKKIRIKPNINSRQLGPCDSRWNLGSSRFFNSWDCGNTSA